MRSWALFMVLKSHLYTAIPPTQDSEGELGCQLFWVSITLSNPLPTVTLNAMLRSHKLSFSLPTFCHKIQIKNFFKWKKISLNCSSWMAFRMLWSNLLFLDTLMYYKYGSVAGRTSPSSWWWHLWAGDRCTRKRTKGTFIWNVLFCFENSKQRADETLSAVWQNLKTG